MPNINFRVTNLKEWILVIICLAIIAGCQVYESYEKGQTDREAIKAGMVQSFGGHWVKP